MYSGMACRGRGGGEGVMGWMGGIVGSGGGEVICGKEICSGI